MPAKVEHSIRRFEVGNTVLAKWPKTTLYYKGEIIDHNDIEYLIRFDDEGKSELPIKYKDVMPVERARSRSRGRTPPRSQNKRSPARKSPARKSLPRKTSPIKKSPGRPKRVTEDSAVIAPKVEVEKKVEEKSKDNLSPTLRSRAPTRQSLRIASTSDKAKVDGLSSNNIKVDVKAITKTVESQSSFKNYLYRAGKSLLATSLALPMIVSLITLTFILNQMCTKNKCSIRDTPDIPRKLQYYFNQKALAVTGTFVLSLLLLSFVPIGKVIIARSGATVRCNGFISLILCCGILPVLQILKYDVVSLYLLYRHFMVAFAGLGIILSVVVYIKSFYARKDSLNSKGCSGYWIPDFVEGREVHPSIWNIDIKFFLCRLSMLIILMINILIVLKSIHSTAGSFSPTLLVASSFQVLYIIDEIWFEDCYFSTYDYKNQGTGLTVCLGYLNMPFLFAMFPRFVFNHRSELPWYCLVGLAVLYVIGYVIFRGSTSQKHAFRTNPTGPALAHLESLPTSSGRLLVSGWWGFVRHPNYLGNLLMQLSMASICGFMHAIPWVVYGVSVSYLLLRLYHVESYCKKKYGLGWASYTSRVKHRIIPKVF